MNVDNRIKLEKRVVRHLIRTMKKHGWVAGKVNDGEEDYICKTEKDVMDNAFAVEEATVVFFNTKLMRHHSVFLVFGNDGYDVICDYNYSETDNFATIMETEVDSYTDKLSEQYC